MARCLPYAVALAAALTSSCGRDRDAGTATRHPEPATLAGVYSGEFPCSNCAAIAATVWLRPDNTFFLRQRFIDDAATEDAQTSALREPSATFGLGRWHWDELAAQVVLRGAGPERRLTVLRDDSLQLRVASATAHIVTRDAAALPFGDQLTLDGESAVSENGATFTECLTGLTLTVADAGAYRELRRQHRRMNPRGNVALTTVQGHLMTMAAGSAASERLVIDELITIKPGTAC